MEKIKKENIARVGVKSSVRNAPDKPGGDPEHYKETPS